MAMLDLHDSARAQPHELFRRVFEPDTHWEALSNTYPIQRPLHVRWRAREIDPLCVQHAPSDTFDGAFDRPSSIDHRKDGCAITDGNGLQIRLPEIGDGKPLFRVDQSEQPLRWKGRLARRDSQTDHSCIVLRRHRRVLERAFGYCQCCLACSYCSRCTLVRSYGPERGGLLLLCLLK